MNGFITCLERESFLNCLLLIWVAKIQFGGELTATTCSKVSPNVLAEVYEAFALLNKGLKGRWTSWERR